MLVLMGIVLKVLSVLLTGTFLIWFNFLQIRKFIFDLGVSVDSPFTSITDTS